MSKQDFILRQKFVPEFVWLWQVRVELLTKRFARTFPDARALTTQRFGSTILGSMFLWQIYLASPRHLKDLWKSFLNLFWKFVSLQNTIRIGSGRVLLSILEKKCQKFNTWPLFLLYFWQDIVLIMGVRTNVPKNTKRIGI